MVSEGDENEYSQNNCIQFFRIVKKVGKQFDQIQRQILKKEKVTPPQLFILRQLWKNDGLQSKELAEMANSSRSTITGVVDTLEKNGFVERELNPNDRRSWLVKLTEKGKKFRNYSPKMDIKAFCPSVEAEKIKEIIQFLQDFSNSIVFPKNNKEK